MAPEQKQHTPGNLSTNPPIAAPEQKQHTQVYYSTISPFVPLPKSGFGRPPTPGSSQASGSGPRFPKIRIPVDHKPSTDLGSELATTQRKLTNLESELAAAQRKLDFADRKIKAFTTFGSHQDNVIAIFGSKFFELKVASETDIATRERVEREVNDIMTLSDMLPRSLVSRNANFWGTR